MDKDTKTMIVSQVIAIVIGLAVTILVAIWFGVSIYSDLPFGYLFLFAACMVAVMLHILVHEMGHVIFGKLSGYKFMAIIVLGMCLVKDNGKIRRTHLPLMGAAGGTLILPEGGFKEDTPYRMMLLGGAFMNILLAAVCGIVFIMDIHPLLNVFMWGGMIIGIFVAIPNLIPFSFGFMVNDAMMIRLFKKDEASKHCVHYGQMRMYAILLGTDRTAIPVPEHLPHDNRLGDSIRFAIAEDELNFKRFGPALERFKELLGNFEENSFAYKLVDLHILLIHELNGADREVIDEIYKGKMRKFVDAQGKAIPMALLFRVSYEKRFGTGSVNVDRLVKMFNKLTRKVGSAADFEREIMASLLAGGMRPADDNGAEEDIG